jgi:hypothetical protein
MLENRALPSKLKNSKDPSNSQTGKRKGCRHVKVLPNQLNRYRREVLEKLLNKRITHHLYTTEYLNENQYGFTHQKNTVDAAMQVEQYLENHLERGE